MANEPPIVLQLNKDGALCLPVPSLEEESWVPIFDWERDSVTGKSRMSDVQTRNSKGMGLWGRAVFFARVRYGVAKPEVGEVRMFSFAQPENDLEDVS